MLRHSLEADRLPARRAPDSDAEDASEWLPAALDEALEKLRARNGGRHAAIIEDLIGRADGGGTPRDLAHGGTPVQRFRARRALLEELEKAIRRLSPAPELAEDRVRWLRRQAVRQCASPPGTPITTKPPDGI